MGEGNEVPKRREFLPSPAMAWGVPPRRVRRRKATSVSRAQNSSRRRLEFQIKVGRLSLSRWIKALVYPLLPSSGTKWHEKRRKGLAYRDFPEDGLECQQEQDRVFWSAFLHPERGGRFLEIGGDGVTGSHTLGLELLHDWSGAVYAMAGTSLKRAKEERKCRVLDLGGEVPEQPRVDLLALHQPMESVVVLEALRSGKLQSNWVIVQNREPDPHWCGLLEAWGYKLRFFFHDDEYYQLKS